MTRVKICGVTRPEDALVAAECGAWAVGFVFYPKSSRFVNAEQALKIAEALPKEVKRVGIFMDASADVVRRVERKVPLDLIQLHGRDAAKVGAAVGLDRVVLAVVLQSEADAAEAAKIQAAHLLVDRRRAAGEPSGASVRWELAERLARLRPETLLAGALTAENVGEAMRAVRPRGVDVSGGVESAPGVKDAQKIRRFIEAVRKADEEAAR